MRAEELERRLEAVVGRGVWFTAAEIGNLFSLNPHARNTLIHRDTLERRELARSDPRRSVTSRRYEYRLLPR